MNTLHHLQTIKFNFLVIVCVLLDFHVHDTIVWWNFEGFPVFFGMVTAAFEGIGLVCRFCIIIFLPGLCFIFAS